MAKLTGNIIVSEDGKQHQLDNHSSFDERIKNYVVGTNLIALATPPEIAQGRDETLEALCDILQKRGTSPVKVVGRFGTKLNENQVLELRTWLAGLKGSNN